jgi:hypothetical protein
MLLANCVSAAQVQHVTHISQTPLPQGILSSGPRTLAGCEMWSHVWQLKSGLPLSMMALKMSSSYRGKQA